jgi:hypothetical protein
MFAIAGIDRVSADAESAEDDPRQLIMARCSKLSAFAEPKWSWDCCGMPYANRTNRCGPITKPGGQIGSN